MRWSEHAHTSYLGLSCLALFQTLVRRERNARNLNIFNQKLSRYFVYDSANLHMVKLGLWWCTSSKISRVQLHDLVQISTSSVATTEPKKANLKTAHL